MADRETGWSIAANCLGIERLPVKAGSPTRPCPGWDVRVLDHAGDPTPAGDIGAICVKLPLPPGTFPTLWNADQRYRETYFAEYPGYYKTGDAGLLDEDGYVHVMARTDDVINVAGHRLSTGAIEEVLATHPDVAECAVIGAADDLKGQLPVGLVVLNVGTTTSTGDVATQCVQLVRDRIGAVAAFKTALVVERLPKTRSGKILRGTIKKIADGEPYKVTPTIEDEAVLPKVADVLASAGLRQIVRRYAYLHTLCLRARKRTPIVIASRPERPAWQSRSDGRASRQSSTVCAGSPRRKAARDDECRPHS